MFDNLSTDDDGEMQRIHTSIHNDAVLSNDSAGAWL